MRGLIDSHFHVLQMQHRGMDIPEILSTLHGSGWRGGIDIGVDEDDLALRHALLAHHPEILLAAGVGPWGAAGDEPIGQVVERFTLHVRDIPFAFIGEIGLDHHWNYGTPGRQAELFESQLALAERLAKPVIIHSRDADDDMQRILLVSPLGHGGIMHCYSSGRLLLETALACGLHISFAGPITYRKNDALREMLAAVPLERLLLETDSPYLAPEPFRGRPNSPLHMPQIYAEAARVRKMDLDELTRQIGINFEQLCSRCGNS